MLLEVTVDNINDINEQLEYNIKNPTIYTDLITPDLVKIYFAHRLFYNDENQSYFQSINDYIYIKESTETESKDTEYENYTIARNIKSYNKLTSKWKCKSLVFDTLIFLNTDDITHSDFDTFFDDRKKFFPNIKPLDILYMFITNTVLNVIDNSSEIYDLLVGDLRSTVDIIFNYNRLKPNEYRSRLLDISDELVKLYKINSRKFNVEQNFLIRYDNVVKIFQDIEKKCSIASEKIDTHLDIVFNIESNFDVFELFNNFKPSNIIPFMHISDFNKILTEYRVPEEWLEEVTAVSSQTNTLLFYILNDDDEPEANKIKPASKYYSKCMLKELNQIDDKFELEITIEIERTKIKDENDRNKLIVKLLKNLPNITSQTRIVVNERVAKGYILYNLRNNLPFIDVPILRHYFLIDDFVNYFLSLEQQYTIERTRGGESLYFYHNYIANALLQPILNYDTLYKNIDGKCNLIYDKIGRDSKTRIKFPVNFESSKGNIPDVLIIKYSRLNIDENVLKNIIDRLLCYMSDKTNLDLIKSAYENCL
jgi:hypothetical protein